jgi:hypothetical protein
LPLAEGKFTIYFMKTAKQLFSFGWLIILTGCVTLYKPNTINSPMLKEKGELNTSASLAMSGCGLVNIQSSYAISDHMGVMLDGMYHTKQLNVTDSSVERLNILFSQLGAGFFSEFGNNNYGLFQCFGGVGYGITRDKLNNSYSINPEVSANYLNVFIQPGLAVNYYFMDIAFDLRVNYVHLFNINSYLIDPFEWWAADSKFYTDTTLNFMLLEPAMTIRVGDGKIKGLVQLGATFPIVNPDSYYNVSPNSMLLTPLFKFSFGINYTFGTEKL